MKRIIKCSEGREDIRLVQQALQDALDAIHKYPGDISSILDDPEFPARLSDEIMFMNGQVNSYNPLQ